MKDARSSLTGTCGKRDPKNPVCAKLTLTGKLKLVDSQSEEADYARGALFSKHAEMLGWPKDHDFQIFQLEIESIFLIDWFGGPKPLSPGVTTRVLLGLWSSEAIMPQELEFHFG